MSPRALVDRSYNVRRWTAIDRGDDLGLTLQTGFVTKALVGLFGSDRFRLTALDDTGMYAQNVALGRHEQPVRVRAR